MKWAIRFVFGLAQAYFLGLACRQAIRSVGFYLIGTAVEAWILGRCGRRSV